VITTDYAAGPEQVSAGLVVPYSDYVILNTPGTRYALADIEKMAEALTKIYNADREKLARKARAFSERYDWDRIVDVYWKPFLEKCEGELRPLFTKEGRRSWD
jgi:glycosyltransferase involved in cell wall biosynthesis